MANCLDIVPVRIKHKCCIVVWVILRAKSRHAVFNSADGQTRSEENINIRSRSCTESNVDAGCHRGAFRYPKVTTRIGAFPMTFRNAKAGCARTVLTKNITERPQGLEIKCLAFSDVTYSDPYMINHQLPLFGRDVRGYSNRTVSVRSDTDYYKYQTTHNKATDPSTRPVRAPAAAHGGRYR